MTEPYHYRESGIDNVWLTNGFTIRDDPHYGPLVFFDDLEGLHKAIGRNLIEDTRNLTGREFRFLRHELGMSQAGLAWLLGVSEQAVARWEKGKTRLDPAADRVLRFLYRDKIGGRGGLDRMLEMIADLEERVGTKRMFSQKADGWEQAA